MDHPFRSAVFGGFNRQDVLDFLEKTSAENAQRLQELQRKLEEAEEERRKLSDQAAAQEEQLAALRRERESLNQQLEQVRQALALSEDRGENQEGELTALRQEREELKARVEALEPEAAAYEAVKERTARIELEAHQRAQNALDQADGQARELRRSMEQWAGRVEREYEDLRAQVEAAISHAQEKLGKAGESLEKINALLAGQEVALGTLSQEYSQSDPDKVPAPVPLDLKEN